MGFYWILHLWLFGCLLLIKHKAQSKQKDWGKATGVEVVLKKNQAVNESDEWIAIKCQKLSKDVSGSNY